MERALNDRYNLVNSEHNEEDAISIPEARAVLEAEWKWCSGWVLQSLNINLIIDNKTSWKRCLKPVW